jgi:spore germination cell wall hydrolase CwlJ-like protein
MSAHLSVARSALKLGFFVSSLTVASLGARLATANVSPGGDDRAFGVSAARASGGDLSDRSLRQTFDAEGSDLFARHDPGLKQPIAFDILKGYEQGAPLARWDLPPQSAQTANQAVPVSVEPILPAKPFVFHGDAADRQAALTCLTQAVYYEAGFEPIEGAQAVAQVVLNRVRHPIFPKSVCGVVYQGASLKTGCQFSFACDGSLNKTPAAGAWARAKAVAERALGGYVAKDVGEATHYHTNYVLPWWAPTVTKIAEVGTQIFYRWPGALGMSSPPLRRRRTLRRKRRRKGRRRPRRAPLARPAPLPASTSAFR